MSTPDTAQPTYARGDRITIDATVHDVEGSWIAIAADEVDAEPPTAWISALSVRHAPTEEPDFLAGAAACSLNPDDEDCEACQ